MWIWFWFDPGLDVAGPRLHIAPADGLPLLRLTTPTFTGLPRVIKHAGDRLAAAVALLLIAPVLLVIAVAVRLGGGPVFFRQARLVQRGRPLKMITFRSVTAHAERRRIELVPANQGVGPQFKLRNDPRITLVGT